MNPLRSKLGQILAVVLLLGWGSAARSGESLYNQSEAACREVLRTGSPDAKALACKQLAVCGTAEAAAELTPLLADPQLNSWARIALEVIPGAQVDEALVKALEPLQSSLAVGVINSIGVRKSLVATAPLAKRLQDADPQIAAAAAAALGQIATVTAGEALLPCLKTKDLVVRDAVAIGCVQVAEARWHEKKIAAAVEVYQQVRAAEVSPQRKREAIRGMILAQGAQGLPLLVEQLQSADRSLFNLGLGVAREVASAETGPTLLRLIPKLPVDRAALVMMVLADRTDTALGPELIAVARQGDESIRLSAIEVLGRLEHADCLPTLLELAIDPSQNISKGAREALVKLQGVKVNAEITQRLSQAQGPSLVVLLNLIGSRRIAVAKELLPLLTHADPQVRQAALVALGEVAEPEHLEVLLQQATQDSQAPTSEVALQALRAACVRMPDRDACSAKVAAALKSLADDRKPALVEILGQVGGKTALATIASQMKEGNEAVRDAGSRALGQWMTVDAAPVLLSQAQDAKEEKYHIRAIRGYIRLLRQFTKDPQQRADMARAALLATRRADDQRLVFELLERNPSLLTLRVAVEAAKEPRLREGAIASAHHIADKLKKRPAEVEELLKQLAELEAAKA